MIDLKIKYQRQKRIKGKLFDFFIYDKNLLIETDGDFYHCNPEIFQKPLYETQINNIENDKIKNQIAKDAGYKLLRFWEYDIKNDKEFVIQALLAELEEQ